MRWQFVYSELTRHDDILTPQETISHTAKLLNEDNIVLWKVMFAVWQWDRPGPCQETHSCAATECEEGRDGYEDKRQQGGRTSDGGDEPREWCAAWQPRLPLTASLQRHTRIQEQAHHALLNGTCDAEPDPWRRGNDVSRRAAAAVNGCRCCAATPRWKRSFQLLNSTFVKPRIEITGLCFHRSCRNVGKFTKCWDVSVHSLEWSPAAGDHLFSSIHKRPFPHAEMRFCISTGSIPHKSNRCGKRNFSKK